MNLEFPDWSDFVIKDAKVSDHNETPYPPATVEIVREWRLSRNDDPHRIGRWIHRLDDAAEVLAAIRILLGDPEEETRVRAAMALAAMGPRAFPARGDLVRALQDPSGFVVDFSLRALAQCGIPAEPALPRILTLLRSGERKVRYSAAALIGRMGPIGEFAVPELHAMLREDDSEMFNAAARSRAGIGPAAAPAVRVLADGLDREDRCVASAGALGAVGPAARALERIRATRRE